MKTIVDRSVNMLDDWWFRNSSKYSDVEPNIPNGLRQSKYLDKAYNFLVECNK